MSVESKQSADVIFLKIQNIFNTHLQCDEPVTLHSPLSFLYSLDLVFYL
jgi:hypothetical protein